MKIRVDRFEKIKQYKFLGRIKMLSTRLIYLQTCDTLRAVALYAARNSITHLSVVSSRQRSYDRRRCENAMTKRCEI